MKSLHDAISPAYHQEKGPSRDEQTCAALPKMKEASSAVAAERTADEAKNAAMTQALAGLETACQANGRPEVAAKFEAVHEAFHAYMEGEKH